MQKKTPVKKRYIHSISLTPKEVIDRTLQRPEQLVPSVSSLSFYQLQSYLKLSPLKRQQPKS